MIKNFKTSSELFAKHFKDNYKEELSPLWGLTETYFKQETDFIIVKNKI